MSYNCGFWTSYVPSKKSNPIDQEGLLKATIEGLGGLIEMDEYVRRYGGLPSQKGSSVRVKSRGLLSRLSGDNEALLGARLFLAESLMAPSPC